MQNAATEIAGMRYCIKMHAGWEGWGLKRGVRVKMKYFI